jgi:hypothetical protein
LGVADLDCDSTGVVKSDSDDNLLNGTSNLLDFVWLIGVRLGVLIGSKGTIGFYIF